MLVRCTDAKLINEIVNHPSIFPFVKGDQKGKFDLTPVVANTDHVFLLGEHGCVFFIKHNLGFYEFHTAVLPSGRGKWMVEGAYEAFRYMFTKTDAFELLTKCPDGNIASKAGAKAVGCSMMFRTGNIWPHEGKMVPVDVYSITIQAWMKIAPSLVQSGVDFHNNLEEKYRILGKTGIHEEDDTHNRYVGMCVEMIRGEHPLKGVYYYNRWAVMAGFQKISVVSLNPLVIDIREARLRINGNDFEVTLCPQAEQMSSLLH